MFLDRTDDSIHKLQLIDNIQKLGLSRYFEDQIEAALDDTMAFANIGFEPDLYATSLCFRILRQYGYTVSQGTHAPHSTIRFMIYIYIYICSSRFIMSVVSWCPDMFSKFVDETGNLRTSRDPGVRGMMELFHAANLSLEEECILQQAILFSKKWIRGLDDDINPDTKLVSIDQNYDLSLPLHWRVEWYNIKKQIYATENQYKTNSELVELVELAKLNFNIVQAAHQRDVKDLSRYVITKYLMQNNNLTLHKNFHENI